ncbi:MAG: type IVB secretion system protein DotG/IcmE, partial [Legionellaceae bacterium]|nr:type IVB secretion system protein DotG/IcmE [Legionellaceae bacterium]
SALRAAGFTAKDLKDAGFTAAELRNAGFTAADLRAAGFSAKDLLHAGFSPAELAAAGYAPAQIQKAELAAESLALPSGVTPDSIAAAGCSADAIQKERAAGVSAAAIRMYAHCSAMALHAGGFSDDELAAAGFSPQEIAVAHQVLPAGFTPESIAAAGCSVDAIKKERAAGVSAAAISTYAHCSATALHAAGFSDEELSAAGFSPQDIALANEGLPPGMTLADIKAAGCSPAALKKEYDAGVSAKLIHEQAGCSATALRMAGFNNADLEKAGFSPDEIQAANEVLPPGVTADQIKAAGCSVDAIQKERAAGVSALLIKKYANCSAASLHAAGFSDSDLEMAGFSPQEIASAHQMTPMVASATANIPQSCDVASLREARAKGVSAMTIRETLGCSASALKEAGYSAAELKAAGFTASELRNAGFSAAALKEAGFSARNLREAGFSAAELKAAGYSAAQLKEAGFSASELKAAGFSAAELKSAGFSAKALKEAGFSAKELEAAGFSPEALKKAGFSQEAIQDAGYSPATLQAAGISPKNIGALAPNNMESAGMSNASRSRTQGLQSVMARQKRQMLEQKYQQNIQQRASEMSSAASQLLQAWKTVPAQMYVGGSGGGSGSGSGSGGKGGTNGGSQNHNASGSSNKSGSGGSKELVVKTGDILFAVIDTAINSDEPGPVLGTIVAGKLKNSKIIGSFTVAPNSDKMAITFNTLSIPGVNHVVSMSAYAVDPDTARTALATRVDHHYLLRYGSLFASSFIEGFGNAFQAADTTVTIGGTGGGDNITVQQGINRSALENAVIGLSTVGKNWGQLVQEQVHRPKTIELASGTPVGLLFIQDLSVPVGME